MRRRTVLSGLAAAAVGSIAGCGYRPGGGDGRWELSPGLGGVDFIDAEGDRLSTGQYAEQDYDPESQELVDVGTASLVDPAGDVVYEHQFESPLVALSVRAESVFAVLSDGSVARVDPVRGGTTAEDDDDDVETEIRWRTSVFEPIDAAGEVPLRGDPPAEGALPTIEATGDGVYATDRSSVAAMDPADGTREWRWEYGGEIRRIEPGPDGVYALAGDRVRALHGSGSPRWAEDWSDAEYRSGLLADDSGVYLLDGTGIRALAHDGSERWTRDVGVSDEPSPTLQSGTLYVASGGSTDAVSTADGNRQWSASVHGDTGRIGVEGDEVYVTDGYTLFCIRAGSEAWAVDLDSGGGLGDTSGPFVVGETIVLENDGTLRGHWRSQL